MLKKSYLTLILILLFLQGMQSSPNVFGLDVPEEPFDEKTIRPSIIKLMEEDFKDKETVLDNSTPLEPKQYKILIDLVDIEEIDLKNEAYEIVFWIFVSSDEVNFLHDEKPQLDFVNGRIDLLMEETITENFYKAKIFGTFFSDHVQFGSYPFMEFPVSVIVSPLLNTDHVVLVVDEEKFDDEISIPGWKLKDITLSSTNELGPKSQLYSTFVAKYTLEKPHLSAFLTGVLPIIVMLTIVGLLSFMIPTIGSRIDIIVGVLIAAVFFHVADLGNTLPPLIHLTLEDKMMTILYSMLIILFTEHLVVERTRSQNDEKKAKSINRKIQYILLLVTGTLATIFAFL